MHEHPPYFDDLIECLTSKVEKWCKEPRTSASCNVVTGSLSHWVSGPLSAACVTMTRWRTHSIMWYLATATFALVCAATDVLSASVPVGDVDTLIGVIPTRGGDADYFVDAPTTPVPASPAAGSGQLLAISCMSLNVSREGTKSCSINRACTHRCTKQMASSRCGTMQ